MAKNSFTILTLNQASALKDVLADETAKKTFAESLQQLLSDYKQREAANRMGGRKPSELYFVDKARLMPIFKTDESGKPVVPSTPEEWTQVRVTYVYPYSTKPNGKEVGFFYGGQIFKVHEVDGVPTSGIGGLNAQLQEWENSVERLGMSNEEAANATQEKLKAAGKVDCATVIIGKNRTGTGDLFGYNLSKAED